MSSETDHGPPDDAVPGGEQEDPESEDEGDQERTAEE